jgi:hypothetical protein
VISIDTLPDEVLLAIFDFCVDEVYVSKEFIEAWQLLVHVCRRWRSIVFGSPLRLNLQLVGTPKTPVRDTLNVWPPALPLVVLDSFPPQRDSSHLNNTIKLLEHNHCVCQISLDVSNPQLEEVAATMQVPFPELTNLQLSSYDEMVPVLHDSFLGGSAPRLRRLHLGGIQFPGLPKLLLSATHLVELYLVDIPHSWYIPPETMVIALSTLINLKSLSLMFQFPRSRPDGEIRCPSPPTRSVLPVLTYFVFNGLNEYLEDFVARIDAPLLNSLFVTLLNQMVFYTTQFTRFIGRTPELKAFKEAHVSFDYNAAQVELSSTSGCRVLNVTVPCGGLEQQLLSLQRACTSSLPPLSTSEDLYVCKASDWQPNWKDRLQDAQDNFENTLWLELFRPFIAVRNLYLSEDIVPRIVPALQQAVIGGTMVLPTLQNIFLEELEPSGPIREAIEQFVAARQVTSHPIAVSCWERWTVPRTPMMIDVLCLLSD